MNTESVRIFIKTTWVALFATALLFSCTNSKEQKKIETKVTLRPDSLNRVRIGDTLVINEGICRACAYEKSTHFEITDTADIIHLEKIITMDNNPPSNADGGVIAKQLLLVPSKTGSTIIKLFKFYVEQPSAEDSTKFTLYNIEVIK